MVERPKGFIHRHTPSGRYEEYRAKYDSVLAQTQGEARYLFEKKLDTDAKRYAGIAVARDILVTAVLITGAVLIGREIKNKTLGATLASIPLQLRGLTDSILMQTKEKTNAVLQHVGAQVAEGAVVQAKSHLPSILEAVREQAPGIGQAAASGALTEIAQAAPAVLDGVEDRMRLAGVTLATAVITTFEANLPSLAEAFGASVRAAGLAVLFGSKKRSTS